MKRTSHLLAIALLAATVAHAQNPPEATTRPRRAQTPLQLRVLLGRQQADKTLKRLSYTLVCVANAGRRTSLKMGVQVPVPLGEGKGFQYRNVGTDIDCDASALDDGLYRIDLGIEQSSVDDSMPGKDGTPLFQTFNSTFVAVLRDGQGAIHTAATDPVTGQESTIEVSLKVMK